MLGILGSHSPFVGSLESLGELMQFKVFKLPERKVQGGTGKGGVWRELQTVIRAQAKIASGSGGQGAR